MDRALRYLTFVIVALADIVLLIGPFLLKTSGDVPSIIWLIAAVIIAVAGTAKLALKRRPGAAATAW
jgi:hypothetical protein